MKITVKARVNAAFRIALALLLAVTLVPAFLALYAGCLVVSAAVRVVAPAIEEGFDAYADLFGAIRNRARVVFA